MFRLREFSIAACAGLLLALSPAHAVAEEDASSRRADQAPAAAPARADRTLDLREFAVDGNTLLRDEDIRVALAPFLGPARTPADVDRARDALQRAYHARGFQSVSVGIAAESRRTVADGLVIFTVTEGRIRHLSVSGAEYSSVERIRAQVPSLREGDVPDFNALQAELAALNRQRDRAVTPTVRLHEPDGGLDVELAVSETLPLHGLFELNNRRSNGTSDLRAMALFSWDNAWQRGDSVSLMAQTSPLEPDEGQTLFVSWLARTALPTFTWQLSALDSQSDVAAVGGISVLGDGSTFGLRGNWQLPALGDWQPTLSAGIDYKDFRNRVVVAGGGTVESPLTYVPVSVSLAAQRRGEAHTLRLSLDGMTTLPALGSDSWEIGDQNRYGATRQMRWLRGGADVALDRPDGSQWGLALNAQGTDLPLVSNEQFSAGGMDSVRGYFEAEAAGDVGATASVEYRLPAFVSWFDASPPSWLGERGRAYVFADLAHVALRGDVPAGQARDNGFYATGVGATADIGRHLHAVVEWALPLTDGPYTERQDSRLLFRLWGTF